MLYFKTWPIFTHIIYIWNVEHTDTLCVCLWTPCTSAASHLCSRTPTTLNTIQNHTAPAHRPLPVVQDVPERKTNKHEGEIALPAFAELRNPVNWRNCRHCGNAGLKHWVVLNYTQCVWHIWILTQGEMLTMLRVWLFMMLPIQSWTFTLIIISIVRTSPLPSIVAPGFWSKNVQKLLGFLQITERMYLKNIIELLKYEAHQQCHNIIVIGPSAIIFWLSPHGRGWKAEV